MTSVTEKKPDIIATMFIPAAISMIFTSLARFLAGTIDGVITSKFLGSEAYSGISLFAPMVNIIILFATFIAMGCQVLCSLQIGAGKKKEANAVFSFAVISGLAVAAIFILLGVISPAFLVRICGVKSADNAEIYAYMMRYLGGYLIGIPALILVQVLGPFIVIDNGKKMITLSALVLFAGDTVFDLLNVFIFHGGVFGMGIATSCALWFQAGVLCTHFLSGRGYFHISLAGFNPGFLTDICKDGGLVFLRTLATILRDLFTNHLNISLAATTAAIAAKGIQTDLNTLMFSIGIGISQAVLPMTAMFYGADDRRGMKRLFSCFMNTSFITAGGMGLIMFFGAPLITMLYTNDSEVASLANFGIRCMAAGLLLDTVAVVYQSYLQGIQRIKLVNFLCFAERFFVPVAVAFVMGSVFGSKGILASIAIGKLVLLMIVLVIICLYNKGLPVKPEDFMLLDDAFGVEEGAEQYRFVRTPDDAVACSEDARIFCINHGWEKRKANLVALYVEEMSTNIVKHGKTKNKAGICVDYRLYVKNGKLHMSLRDCCEAFDPTKYYEIHKNDELSGKIGIRMVMNLANKIHYTYTFNSNCTMILME